MLMSNLLKAEMTKCGVSQADLANKLGISIPTLSRKVNGEVEFKLSEVYAVCDYLHIENPVDIFLARESQICNDNKPA